MKALTIHQPYAELIARGEKRVENRTWRTHYRGPLAIHAGARRLGATEYDRKAIVAVVELVDCLQIDVIRRSMFLPLDYEWLITHPHTEGPWCWVLANVRRLTTPIPASGKQGLWDIDLPLGV